MTTCKVFRLHYRLLYWVVGLHYEQHITGGLPTLTELGIVLLSCIMSEMAQAYVCCTELCCYAWQVSA